MGEDFADFSKILLQWYGIHKRDLPWRGVKNSYYVWLSEVILQQTRISQGLPYYLNFIKNFPTILPEYNAKLHIVILKDYYTFTINTNNKYD